MGSWTQQKAGSVVLLIRITSWTCPVIWKESWAVANSLIFTIKYELGGLKEPHGWEEAYPYSLLSRWLAITHTPELQAWGNAELYSFNSGGCNCSHINQSQTASTHQATGSHVKDESPGPHPGGNECDLLTNIMQGHQAISSSGTNPSLDTCFDTLPLSRKCWNYTELGITCFNYPHQADSLADDL